MKTLFFVLCLFLSVEGALSQETGKLYTTLSDLLNETSSSTLNVIKEKRNKNQLFMSGGGDFKIYNGDKELDKEIKKKTFAIEIDDTLYINCIGLKFKKRPIGAWFAPGLICKGKVYFTAIPTGSNTAMAFGVVGAAVQSANAASSRVFYEVDDSEKKLKLDRVDSKKMEELLQRYPELLERYQKEAFKEHIEIVGKYLQAIKQQE